MFVGVTSPLPVGGTSMAVAQNPRKLLLQVFGTPHSACSIVQCMLVTSAALIQLAGVCHVAACLLAGLALGAHIGKTKIVTDNMVSHLNV
jgi:hypothetical protein